MTSAATVPGETGAATDEAAAAVETEIETETGIEETETAIVTGTEQETETRVTVAAEQVAEMAVIGTERGIVTEGAPGTTTETAIGTALEAVKTGRTTTREHAVITQTIVNETEAEKLRAERGPGVDQAEGGMAQQTRRSTIATETGGTATQRTGADGTTGTEESDRAPRVRRASAAAS